MIGTDFLHGPTGVTRCWKAVAARYMSLKPHDFKCSHRLLSGRGRLMLMHRDLSKTCDGRLNSPFSLMLRHPIQLFYRFMHPLKDRVRYFTWEVHW